jgi:hypothetical protein
MARVTLTRYGSVGNVDFEYLGGHRVRVEASGEIGMTAKIFMWHRGPVEGTVGDYVENYERVANMADLVNYPEDAPDEGNEYPEFRRDYLEIDVGSIEDVDAVWTHVKNGVQRLVDALNVYAALQIVETEDIE